MAVYLDHNATSPLLPEVLEAMRPYLGGFAGNPGSIHGRGIAAEAAIDEARRRVARAIGAQEGEVLFTGGGTESNNIAVLGGARARRRRGRHVLVSAAEHDSVHEPARALAQEGFEVTVSPIDGWGIVDVDSLGQSLSPDTVVVACMVASNETGALQPVGAIARRVRSAAPLALVHADGVQALGKVPVRVADLGCDTLSGSAHKLGGPMGVGFLYVRKGVRLVPIWHGGGQERGLRPGTQNVAGIVGLSAALELAVSRLADHAVRWTALRLRLLTGLEEAFRGGGTGRGPPSTGTPLDASVPTTLSVSFPGIRGEVLVRALEERGVVCSTGSACHERQGRAVNRVLEAMGLTREAQEGTLRISMGPDTSADDVDVALRAFRDALGAVAWAFGRRKGRATRGGRRAAR